MSDKTVIGLVAIIILVLLSGVSGCMYAYPKYSVYQQEMAGRAELAQAQYSKMVQVQTAKGKSEAAQYEAESEVIRARGVAKANQIIGDSLKNNEAYLRYLYVNNLSDTKNQVIYIPTEAGLPILEANRNK